MMKRMKNWLIGMSFGCFVPLVVCGCDNTDALINATAVQLETALISIMDVLVTTVVYNTFNIPLY
jgi:hypothetical protein